MPRHSDRGWITVQRRLRAALLRTRWNDKVAQALPQPTQPPHVISGMRLGQRAAFPRAGRGSDAVQHNTPERPRGTWRPTPTFYIVLTALVLRVTAMFVLPQAAVWRSGWEISNVAKSIAAGHGFSSPFAAPTGATAWIPPVYPFLMATAYKVFGVLSPAPGLLMAVFQVAISALTCLPIVKLGEALGNKTASLW